MFKINMSVRDYECDLQGIVNNAVYMNYLEHARHEFMLSKGIDFVALSKSGIDLVVLKSETEYKKSLKPANKFEVSVEVMMQGRVKIQFIQKIISKSNLIVSSVVTGVATKNGRPIKPPEVLQDLFR